MAQVSIAEAAKLVGKDRKTLYRAIKGGLLSATKNPSGMSQVETSELIRFYGALKPTGTTLPQNATVAMPQDETANATPATGALAVLEAENRLLKEQVQDLRNAVRLLEYHRKTWWKFWI